ncbi:PKD domain-containing protein [Niabella beijingensis]|uniref:PKD domain-containing protein n=1 Tax=Niabella beijingensis TaxID=2872700 RepID=UPI001CC02F51|nr:PKD domain-containing protein [Niabella beijingensis]MBZ4189515.1 PKD domain-containing protein [Niabella beijingensis]
MIVAVFAWSKLYSQEVPPSPSVADSSIRVAAAADTFKFSVLLPALTQIPGAPEPFYTHLWDFGDGHFSTESSPEHRYAEARDYDVYLYAVNNYDDGKKPERKKIKVAAKADNSVASVSVAEKDFFKANGVFELKYNCMAKPNDTMVLLAGWKNTGTEEDQGKLYLFLNEKIFEQTCFENKGFRFFNRGDSSVPVMPDPMTALEPGKQLKITESGSPPSSVVKIQNYAEANSTLMSTMLLYKNSYVVELGPTAPGTAHFTLAELKVTPEMIRDTNATVTVTGVYVPKKGNPVMHRLNIPVVNSHDPNKMNLKGGRLSYRFLSRHKELTYKVRFQNTGKGPARKVALEISTPAALDPQTVAIKDLSPFCSPCSPGGEKRGCWELEKKETGVRFTFHGIYLPGTNQKGVEDKDSTKGFMEFSIVTKKKLDPVPFKARTAIYFDKNEPIITNYATGRFRKGLSPIVMAGFEKAWGEGRVSDGLVTGLAIAPLTPFRPFLQLELYYKQGIKTRTGNYTFNQDGVIAIEGRKELRYNRLDSLVTNSVSQLKLIPVQLRHNFGNYFSAGAGISVTVDMGGNTENELTYYGISANGTVEEYKKQAAEKIKSFSDIRVQPFIDIQLGKIKLGPHLGLRYYYNNKNTGYGFLYAGWRF